MMNLRNVLHLSIFSLVLALSACDVEVKDKGELPKVDVDADAGSLPEYDVVKKKDGQMPSVDMQVEKGTMPDVDVDTVDIEVGTAKKKVSVPDVDVEMKEKEVEVPVVDIDMPEDDE